MLQVCDYFIIGILNDYYKLGKEVWSDLDTLEGFVLVPELCVNSFFTGVLDPVNYQGGGGGFGTNS